eukprot:1158303-Pelagomonas_calceolata.AAC.2
MPSHHATAQHPCAGAGSGPPREVRNAFKEAKAQDNGMSLVKSYNANAYSSEPSSVMSEWQREENLQIQWANQQQLCLALMPAKT